MFLRSPISTVVTIPIYNYWLYPTLRKLGFNFSPVRRSKSLLLPDVCLTNDPSLSLRRCVEQGRPLHVELQLTVSLRLPLRRGDHDHLCNPAVAGLRDVAMRLPRHRVRRWQRCVAYCELSLLFLRAWSERHCSRLGQSFPSVSSKPPGSNVVYLCDTDWLQPMGGILISVTCEFSLSFRVPSN